MQNKPNNFLKRKLENLIIWVFALGVSGILTLGSAIRLRSALGIAGPWNNLKWILLLVSFTLLFSFLVNKLLIWILTYSTAKKKIGVFTILLFFYVLCVIFFFLTKGIAPPTLLSSELVSGKRGMVIHVADVLTIAIIFVSILVLIESKLDIKVFQSIGCGIKRLSQKIQASFSPDNSHYYQRLFVFLFVGLSLLPLTRAHNLGNLNSDFWGRKWLLNAYSSTRFHLGDQMFDLSIIRKRNWFIYTGEASLDDYQSTQPFSQSVLADIQRKLDHLDDLLQSKGIKLIVIVPPNKNTIYPEYMPSQVTVIGNQSRLDQLLAYQQKHGGFRITDLRPALLNARNERQVYYPCDTHWNPYGAFVAYKEILGQLCVDFPMLQPHSLEDYRYVPTLGSCDLADLAHIPNYPAGLFSLAPIHKYQAIEQDWQYGRDQGSFYVKYPYNEIITTIPGSNMPRLVMYRDSFGMALIPFLSDHFSRAVYLWAYPEDESYYDTEKPDIVILEYSERYLNFLLHLPG